MKGISHFCSGVAVGSLLPQVVRLSEDGSFILLLAGLGGIMPDTLDFRLSRYLSKPDVEIDPDPASPDPQSVARQIAAAVDRAYGLGKPVQVRLHTMQLGADLWRQYSVRFEQTRREVRVRYGPLLSASQVCYPGSDLGLAEGRASTGVPVRYDRDAAISVDVFGAPTFECCRHGDEVEVRFLPWHRRWSHSLTVSALLGGVVALVLGPLYGLVYFLGSVAHIVEDQLGHMGSNLAYPLTQSRTKGFGLFHSGDPLPNLLTVWLCAMVLLFNLDRFSADPVLNPWRYFGAGLVLPWMVILGLHFWRVRRGLESRSSSGDSTMAEVAAEVEEMTG